MTNQYSTIPNGWRVTTLGQLANKIVDNRGKTPLITDRGFELLEVNSISEQQRQPDYSKVSKFVNEETFNTWFRTGNINENDILIPTVGTIGNVSFSKLSRGAIAQNLIAFRTNRSMAEPLLLYYLLKSPIYKNQLLKLDIGGVQPSIKVPHLLALEVCIPLLPEQQAITAVLSSLDDKIELLREQNKTLEATAQAIFKEWFVNFNFPGNTGKMIDSELGEIPEGWRVGSLSGIATFLNGLALQKYPPESNLEYLPVVKIKEMSSGFTEKSDKASAKLDKKYIVKDGDVLFSWSGTLMVDLWKYGTGALNQHLFKVTSTQYSKWFYYYWTKEHLQSFQQTASAKAVTMGHIQRHHLDDALVAIPDKDFMSLANQLLDPLINKFIGNNTQMQSLENIRNILLPKLMRGEVRVKGFDN